MQAPSCAAGLLSARVPGLQGGPTRMQDQCLLTCSPVRASLFTGTVALQVQEQEVTRFPSARQALNDCLGCKRSGATHHSLQTPPTRMPA